ncbi:DUF4349 domain-containing protein [Parachitinimonas caeni]|uniref:DUF4349 domain-containing protein n=1 Tax=Parachitinimonas caeni TaxID=3031301 RepID=A0ABT7DTW4_9NEIS|nr:DUF4349 domain-containing protein [Parachitinimonas caeni]MDK2122575.1 DUF4349 domain-containing protein [Parachitinimonas caeni]
MLRRLLLSSALLPILLACGQKKSEAMPEVGRTAPMTVAESSQPAPPPAAAEQQARGAAGGSPDSAAPRYLAIRHEIELETDAAKVEPLWRSLQIRVAEQGGDIINARLSRSDLRSPTATLSLRLPPTRVDGFLKQLEGSATIVDQHTNSEDKTIEVVDVEARLKNLTEARDRLRRMQSEKTGKLSDVLEVDKALTDTQSQLDSLTSQRKVLAAETSKIRLDLTLHTPRSIGEASALEPLRHAWRNLGHVFFSSFGTVLEFLAAILPWLALFTPIVIWWRRRKRARQAIR